MKFEDTTIYPIIIPEFCSGCDPLWVLEEILKGGAKVVQLRDKVEPERYVSRFRKITRKYNALFFVNDRIDLALSCGADGVHIGQEDMDIVAARKQSPNLLIGVSVNNLDQALAAERGGADYVTIGVAFPTQTKLDVRQVTGVELIREVSPHLKIPFVAIGGINLQNLDQLLALEVKHIAVATAITEAEDVQKAAFLFAKKINKN